MFVRFTASLGSLFALAFGAGCTLQSGNLSEQPSSVTASVVNETPKKPSQPSATDRAAEVCNRPMGNSRRDQVCHRWACEGGAAAAPAHWTGESSSCSAGDFDDDAANRALAAINLHRFLADVPQVAVESDWAGPAQQCALLAHANAKLSHTPPSDWRCWSNTAAATSAVSLIANRSAPPAIAAFIEDPGNEDTMVHRRWLLSEELTEVGLGSTDHYSCVVVEGQDLPAKAPKADKGDKHAKGAAAEKRGWVAWPPAGPVPIDVFESEHLDEIGWTIQSSSDDLDRSSVSVSVSVDGASRPVRVSHLTALHGSRSAIRFVPDGWKTETGRSYAVSVRGPMKIDFTVEAVDCL
jgi:hypothetical protein